MFNFLMTDFSNKVLSSYSTNAFNQLQAMPNPLQAPTQNASPNPLDELAGVALGEPITWWPLAWGWWVLIAMCIVSLGIGIKLIITHRRHIKCKRDALKQLDMVDLDCDKALPEIHAILRQCAIHYWSRAEVAKLSGQAWKDFLQQADITNAGRASQISLLEQSLHAPNALINAEQAKQAVCAWLQSALPPKQGDVRNV